MLSGCNLHQSKDLSVIKTGYTKIKLNIIKSQTFLLTPSRSLSCVTKQIFSNPKIFCCRTMRKG